jgi:deoxyadenosine/deoxycytidine kinase/uncharacterized protein (DUF486 family)
MIESIPAPVRMVALLTASNVFMTFAWYGHLKYFEQRIWIVAALASWGIALFEYLLMVPANRIGYAGGMSLAQLKITQEVITLAVFVPFALLFMKQPLKLDFPLGGALPRRRGLLRVRSACMPLESRRSTRPGHRALRHIAVEGPIGAGKTTLAQLLAARLGAELMLEQPAENPFLDRFYADMPGYAFQTQLFFLFQRERQVRSLAQSSMFGQGVVSDFMFAKDAIFAKLTLSDEEYRLYAQMHAPIAAQLREPDVVVWLQARPETLLERLHRRGIAMEQQIEIGYLERLADAYVEHFDSYGGAPVFVVDAETFNPIARSADLGALIEALGRFTGRRGSLVLGDDAALD